MKKNQPGNPNDVQIEPEGKISRSLSEKIIESNFGVGSNHYCRRCRYRRRRRRHCWWQQRWTTIIWRLQGSLPRSCTWKNRAQKHLARLLPMKCLSYIGFRLMWAATWWQHYLTLAPSSRAQRLLSLARQQITSWTLMGIRKYAKLFLIASASSHTHKTILFTEPNNPI